MTETRHFVSEKIVPQEWEERVFEKAEFGILRTYVNRRTGKVRFNADDVARCLGLSTAEVMTILGDDEVSTIPQQQLTESDFKRFCEELEA